MALNPFVGMRTALSQSYMKLSNIPFIFALLFIAVFFWITGPSWFPDWQSSYGDIIIIYIGMIIVFLLWSAKRTQTQMRRSIKDSMAIFVLFFIGTYIILLLLSAVGAISVGSTNPDLFWQTIIMQVCVIATAEELMFRGVVLDMTNVPIQAFIFAIFHSWAYGVRFYEFSWEAFPWLAMIFAFIMGLILGLIAKDPRFGLVACIAIHSCYNVYVSGYFYSLGTAAIIILFLHFYEKRKENIPSPIGEF